MAFPQPLPVTFAMASTVLQRDDKTTFRCVRYRSGLPEKTVKTALNYVLSY